jgi:glucose-1-phosphate thymidylyltransferase
MRAIIPVAGVGSRLRPHTYTLPKVLLNVGGKPIIGHILDRLIENGFDEATIIIGHLGEQIKDYVVSTYRIKVDFVEQTELLGLGHAIYLARHTISRDPILIILGDTIFEVSLADLIATDVSALGVKEVADPRRFGVAELENNYITRLVEKPDQPKSNLALVGIYYIKNPHIMVECLRDEIMENHRTRGEFQLTDALQMMIDRGERMRAFPIEGWFDCGKPETLLETNQYLLDKKGLAPDLPDVVIRPPVYISPGATVHNSIIGPYATVAEDAVVENAIVRDSIVSQGAQVTNAVLEHSIVGNNAVVRGTYKRVNIGDSSELEFL